jgi:hypothetical protein
MNDTVATEDQEQPAWVMSIKLAILIGIPGRRNSSRPAEICSALKAGHMTAADQIVQNEKVLAMRSSTSDLRRSFVESMRASTKRSGKMPLRFACQATLKDGSVDFTHKPVNDGGTDDVGGSAEQAPDPGRSH